MRFKPNSEMCVKLCSKQIRIKKNQIRGPINAPFHGLILIYIKPSHGPYLMRQFIKQIKETIFFHNITLQNYYAINIPSYIWTTTISLIQFNVLKLNKIIQK